VAGQTAADESHAPGLNLEPPALLAKIERELSVYSTGNGFNQDLVDKLRALLIEQVDPEWIFVAPSIWIGAFEPTAKLAGSEKEGASLPEQDLPERWLDRARSLSVGDWLEVRQDEGTFKRIRLVWRGEESLKCVFVNKQGLKEIEYRIAELAQKLKLGEVNVINEADVPYVDQCLYSMAQSVYEKMVFQAMHDPLTGLSNRHQFEKMLVGVLEEARSNHSQHVLGHLEIDQFTVVNNTYGHNAGDQMLIDVSKLLQANNRDRVTITRIGGNEFGLLIENTSEEESIAYANMKREEIFTHRFDWKGQPVKLSVSIGLEMITHDSSSVQRLLADANTACQVAKASGRNRVMRYQLSDKDQQHQVKVLHWAGRIDKMLDENLLQLRCQKIAPLNHEEACKMHYEVLLGVLDDQGKPTSPVLFIEAAERYNRMLRIDQWVVRGVFKWMLNNPVKVACIEGLSINLSGHSVGDDSFLEFLVRQIEDSRIPPEKICFEVTETATIGNLSYAVDFINQVKKTGCRFSLDDFGTGMASYEYLQKLPVDILKIDGIFIKDIHTNPVNFAMVKSINELGHFMGKETIAEFVENNDILEVLREMGIDHVQGYAIEKPKLLQSL
jgi:diguanylate cyclase (GGDEF)-like protein